MNLIQKNKPLPSTTAGEIEVLEGELIEPEVNPPVKETEKGLIRRGGSVELITAIGSAVLGLYRFYRSVSRKPDPAGSMKKRRRRRQR